MSETAETSDAVRICVCVVFCSWGYSVRGHGDRVQQEDCEYSLWCYFMSEECFGVVDCVLKLRG